ncbi:MAG: hypothetical protein E6590_15660 [Clostridiales bacterium]|jgi:hypothetical protein|nr:hypothetical protein [Clostridiales bacterium]MDU6361381.1 hypothetical protein [Clostridiales bacterium]DAV40128.1 MAG TPA: hypothetical protein [Caudoviricetes sp.]
MYKGHKISKRLERYINYAKVKYDKLRVQGYVDLWDVLNGYETITNTPYCVQMYIYDLIKGIPIYVDCYEIIDWMNGGVYVREVVGEVA